MQVARLQREREIYRQIEFRRQVLEVLLILILVAGIGSMAGGLLYLIVNK